MPDLLLTHGYFLYQDAKEVEIMKPYAPLGLLYLSAWLKRDGFDVEVWDSTFAEPAALAARFAASPRGVVGIYTNLVTRPAVLAAVGAAQHHRPAVRLGGADGGEHRGAGEATMSELL